MHGHCSSQDWQQNCFHRRSTCQCALRDHAVDQAHPCFASKKISGKERTLQRYEQSRAIYFESPAVQFHATAVELQGRRSMLLQPLLKQSQSERKHKTRAKNGRVMMRDAPKHRGRTPMCGQPAQNTWLPCIKRVSERFENAELRFKPKKQQLFRINLTMREMPLLD